MKGHIRERSPGRWAIVLDVQGPGGKRRRKWHSFTGKRRDAQIECARLLTEVTKGSYVDTSKVTVAEHVRARVAQWEAAGDITAKTAERYGELVENQIVPHIGAKLIQKLKPLDIEGWHTTLMSSGRKDGAGGISNRTIGHAHRVLSKALREAARHDLVVKNVAAEEGAPKVADDEMVILTEEQLRDLPTKLAGLPIYPRAITAVYTGMRRGELLALRWRNVDLEAKVAKVRKSSSGPRSTAFASRRPRPRAAGGISPSPISLLRPCATTARGSLNSGWHWASARWMLTRSCSRLAPRAARSTRQHLAPTGAISPIGLGSWACPCTRSATLTPAN